jgi:hypothetical protein
VEKLVEELFRGATRSLECGKLVPDDEDLLASARLSFITGYRGLMRIVDGKREGCEAIQQMIRGAAIIGCIALYTPGRKNFIAHRLGSIGGFNSGVARKEIAAQTWHPHALELALKSREQDRHASQDTVADDISARWRMDDPKVPCHKTLTTFISDAEQDGRLQKRKPKLTKRLGKRSASSG